MRRLVTSLMLGALSASMALLSPAAAQTIDYNSVDSLCTAFEGRPIGQARGRTYAITCEVVREMATSLASSVTVPPFRRLTTRIRQTANSRFEDMLADPKESAFRASCSRDFLTLQRSYSCSMNDVPVRFVLKPDGTILRVEISVSTSNPQMQAEISQAAAQTGVDRFSDDGIALLMQTLAMRFRQVSDEDEIYRTDGRTVSVTILNVGKP